MTRTRTLAKMIDHSILHPTATHEDLKRECDIARKYDVASVCVKPYAVTEAVTLLQDADVRVGCVIGFPSGNSSIEIKTLEAERACRDGAVEIDMVVNIGKVLEGDWSYVKKEIQSITETCHAHDAIIKVIFETDYVTDDADLIRLCQICTEVGADYVKTSTGFGFVKQISGEYAYEGATVEHLSLMLEHVGPQVKVKASGGVRTLDQLLVVQEIGCSRCGASATESILRESIARFGP